MCYIVIMAKNMRRKDREKPRAFALAVVDKCPYAVMATVNPDGTPYCIPLSIAREAAWLYFHSARDGHKIENLMFQNRVCITCVGEQKAIPGEFALEYESAVINGTAFEIMDRDEKINALALISRRYTPESMPSFDEAIKRELSQVSVWKIRIEEISGKGRKL